MRDRGRKEGKITSLSQFVQMLLDTKSLPKLMIWIFRVVPPVTLANVPLFFLKFLSSITGTPYLFCLCVFISIDFQQKAARGSGLQSGIQLIHCASFIFVLFLFIFSYFYCWLLLLDYSGSAFITIILTFFLCDPKLIGFKKFIQFQTQTAIF